MKGRISIRVTTLILSVLLLLLPALPVEVKAAPDKVGWVGPIYKELSDSLTKGFKEYYKKTYGKDVEITSKKTPKRFRATAAGSFLIEGIMSGSSVEISEK